MQEATFSIHLPEQLHDRLAKAKQLRVPDGSWADFIELICTESEGNAEQSKRQPWRMAPVKAHPLFAEAIEKVKELEAGEQFTLMNLFEDRWKEVPSPRVFGRLFRQEVVDVQRLALHVDDEKGMAVYQRLAKSSGLFK